MPTTRVVTSRERALYQAREVNKAPYRTFDSETTGLGPNDQITRWAVCDQDGTILGQGRVFPTIPNPHQIKGLPSGLPFNLAWKEMKPLLIQSSPVVIYNADFDTRMLVSSAKPYGITIPSFHAVCAMRMFALYWGDTVPSTGQIRFQSLRDAMATLEIELPGHPHDASYDAIAVARIIHELALIADQELAEDFTLPVLVNCSGKACTAQSFCETSDEEWYCPAHQRKVVAP